MDLALKLLALAVALTFVGWPIALIALLDWNRRRREAAVRRQIALTDAIDGQVGAVVAPVVKKPFWRPWQIEVALPFDRPLTVGRILAVMHQALRAGDGTDATRYRIILAPKQEARQCGESSAGEASRVRQRGWSIAERQC